MPLNVVRFACSNCGAGLQADARAVGFEVECPQCGEILVVPGAKKPPPRPEPEPGPEAPPPPPPPPQEKLVPKVKFCIQCGKDVPEGDLLCPHCGGGRFGRL
jgi:predicted RNA-binding Zn-ribbon protein involved in translation (DUF1610 family)